MMICPRNGQLHKQVAHSPKSTNEWIIDTHTHTHTLEYFSAIKRKEILPCATTWMDLEGIMLTENKTDRQRHVLIFPKLNF